MLVEVPKFQNLLILIDYITNININLRRIKNPSSRSYNYPTYKNNNKIEQKPTTRVNTTKNQNLSNRDNYT